MIERIAVGEVPPKHHIQLRGPDGALRWEECITRDGFEGPFTIAYHLGRPHEHLPAKVTHGWTLPVAAAASSLGEPGASSLGEPATSSVGKPGAQSLAKRHYRTQSLARAGGAAVDVRQPILFNDDVVLGIAFPDADDPVYVVDGDSDTLVFVQEGRGVVRTMLGDVAFGRHDYVFVPRGLPHRFRPTAGVAQYWLTMELVGGLHVPRQWRNEVGQLRMDAPYCHRDFRRPTFVGPVDEGIRELVVKRNGAFHGFTLPRSPLDVVGWDGSVWPWAFRILDFQPRVSSVHLPPTWHGTFAARGALICSFVPRLTDFHPDAIPCPYPHSSVDVDEFLFYVEGNFTSRKGVGPGSVSFHPAGIPHGPHPGSYEKSIGTTRTDELAVMLDCIKPLRPTAIAASVEDPDYMQKFLAG